MTAAPYFHKLWLLIGVLSVSFCAQAQKHAFINEQLNTIKQAQYLSGFTQKMRDIQQNKSGKVHIVHIGDSHIQADQFSGQVRRRLQVQYGNAGRGLVFPYRLARTNGPSDYISFSNTEWQSKRNVFPKNNLPIGLSGITIAKTGPFIFKIEAQSNDSLNYQFDRVKLLYQSNATHLDLLSTDDYKTLENNNVQRRKLTHTVQSGEYLSAIAMRYRCSVQEIMDWNNLSSSQVFPKQRLKIEQRKMVAQSTANQDFEVLAQLKAQQAFQDHFVVRYQEMQDCIFVRSTEESSYTEVYGALLEKSNSYGVMYSMIGVNGAHYKHYNLSAKFLAQLKVAAPDLVVISLGTNESLDKPVAADFKEQVQTLVRNIKNTLPNTEILLTTPTDSYVKRRFSNPAGMQVSRTIVEVAKEMRVGYWDWYNIMGGFQSIALWQNAGLAQSDRIHLSKAGYTLQGDYLLNALNALILEN